MAKLNAAQALRSWRERANMTQGQAAAALGLSRQTYCALERADGPAKRLHLLAAAALEAGLGPVEPQGDHFIVNRPGRRGKAGPR